MTPSDQIKRFIVQLSKDCIEHLSKSLNSNGEKYAFAVKTKALSTLIENYMRDDIKQVTHDYFDELEREIEKIKKRADLNEETKKRHINQLRFEYALPVADQNIRIIQNSPIVEVEAHGIIDMESKGIRDRIQGKAKMLPVREDLDADNELEIIEPPEEEETKSAFLLPDK